MAPSSEPVDSALASLDTAYHMNHRGGEIGHYQFEKLGERHAQVTCNNPYPSDFDYGLIYAMTKRYAGRSSGFTVIRASKPSRLHGDDRCIYDVKW